VLSVFLRYTDSDYLFGIIQTLFIFIYIYIYIHIYNMYIFILIKPGYNNGTKKLSSNFSFVFFLLLWVTSNCYNLHVTLTCAVQRYLFVFVFLSDKKSRYFFNKLSNNDKRWRILTHWHCPLLTNFWYYI
jgi:hypothetical protein